MKCFAGIDLGSTTTKAVVLGEQQDILGRGITNSRSNYEVACSIARNEAFANVRFTLCARALPSTSVPVARHEEFLGVLQCAFRLAQHRAQLRALGEQMVQDVPSVQQFFPELALEPRVREVLEMMERESESLFRLDAPRRSDFFRDTATSQYHRLAAQIAAREKRLFDALLAVFDKSILKAENQEVELPFAQGAGWAIERALAAVAIEQRSLAASVRAALEAAFRAPLEVVSSVGTGYGRATLPFAREQIRSEILCHGLGAHSLFPATATVLDIGGQDTKAIQIDRQGIVTSFQMNDRCAAGCGRYLGYIADEMNLGLHELGPMAERSSRPVKINSTCTVFAGAEIRDRLTLGQKREDILAGLHRAVILRAMSLIARSGGVHDEFTFTGGVARNGFAVRALSELVHRNYGTVTINTSPDSIYTGALGAALFAHRGAHTSEQAA